MNQRRGDIADRLADTGTQLRRQGQLDKAEVYLRAALRLSGRHDHPRLAVRFAYLLRDQGRAGDAIALAEAAYEDYCQRDEAIWSYRVRADLGALCFALPDIRRAISESRKGLRGLSPYDPWYFVARMNLTRGLAYVAEGAENAELESLLTSLRGEGLSPLHHACLDQYEAVQAWRVGLRGPAERALRRVESRVRELGSEIDAAATVLDRLILMALDGRFDESTTWEISEVFRAFGYRGLARQAVWISNEARRSAIRNAVFTMACRFARQIPVQGPRFELRAD